MFPAAPMSNSTSLSEEASVSSGNRVLLQDFSALNPPANQNPQKIKKKRSLPGNPDPDAEVIALSPKTLLATNRFVCEICNKGFQRDQNLQLHRRGHNLPWKLKQRNSKEIKKRAYVCPEPSCVHNHPSRALGDLTGIKKHYCRKHGEKKWKCEKCSKIYAVQSDWKAHSKTCGTREYRCDCGTLFSRKDSFITHRAFCDALAEESARLSAHQLVSANHTALLLQNPHSSSSSLFTPLHHHQIPINPWDPPHHHHHQSPTTTTSNPPPLQIKPETHHFQLPSSSLLFQEPSPFHHTLSNPPTSPAATPTPSSHHLSATALLQKAATVGAAQAAVGHSQMSQLDMTELGAAADSVTQQRRGSSFLGNLSTWQKHDHLTRDFLGLTEDANGNVSNGATGGAAAAVNVSMNMREMLTYTGGVGLQQYGGGERDLTLLKPLGFGFGQQPPPPASETWGDC